MVMLKLGYFAGAVTGAAAGSVLADCLCVTGSVLGGGVGSVEGEVVTEPVDVTSGMLAELLPLPDDVEGFEEVVVEALGVDELLPPRTNRKIPPAMSSTTTTSVPPPIRMIFRYIPCISIMYHTSGAVSQGVVLPAA